MKLGSVEGCDDGKVLRNSDGCSDGAMLGSNDGMEEGKIVGVLLGSLSQIPHVARHTFRAGPLLLCPAVLFVQMLSIFSVDFS